MDLTQVILCMVFAFFLGVSICLFVLWLIFIGIPKWLLHKEEKFEEKVKGVIKRNYEKPMNITKQYLKDLIKEVKNESKNN